MMKEIVVLLAAFLVIGLAWRKFTVGARLTLLGVVVAIIAYVTIKKA